MPYLKDELDYEGVRMLVLSRKKEERIVLGNNVAVVIVDIRGDKVRLGIEAPSFIPAHRDEVYRTLRKSGLILPDLVPAQPMQNTLVGA